MSASLQPSEQTAPAPFPVQPITSDDEAERRLTAALLGPEEPVAPPEPQESAPVEVQPSVQEQASEPEDKSPPIAPPAFWSADAKESFRNLPRDLQETVVEREKARDAETRRAQNEAAEVRKSIETERQATLTERQQYAQRLQSLVPALEAELLRDDFGKLTPQQRLDFARDNPAEFQVRKEQFEQKMNLFQQAHVERQALAQREQEEQERRLAVHLEAEKKVLAEKYPELVDEKTGPALKAQARAYLKERGLSDEQIGGITSVVLVGIVMDAMKGKQSASKVAVAQKKVADLPKVSKPGVTVTNGPNDRAASRQKIRGLRDDNDIAAEIAKYL